MVLTYIARWIGDSMWSGSSKIDILLSGHLVGVLGRKWGQGWRSVVILSSIA